MHIQMCVCLCVCTHVHASRAENNIQSHTSVVMWDRFSHCPTNSLRTPWISLFPPNQFLDYQPASWGQTHIPVLWRKHFADWFVSLSHCIIFFIFILILIRLFYMVFMLLNLLIIFILQNVINLCEVLCDLEREVLDGSVSFFR